MELTVSIAQMDIELGQPDANLNKVAQLAKEASLRRSDWLILPELWSTAYVLEQADQFATPVDAGIFDRIGEISAENKIHIIGSSLSQVGDNQYGNTMTWHSPDGLCVGSYTKLHLFRLMDEHLYLTAGDKPTTVSTAWADVGLAICYDLRFPKLLRHYAVNGAKIVIVPAEWPHPRLHHWRTLLRARAIENQMYVIGCNRVGSDEVHNFCGHSAIIDPWGDTVIEAGENEILLTATINPDNVGAIRQEIPVFDDRRPDLY